GVPITTPAYYDSSRLNRGFFFAQARGQAHAYLMLAFHKVWGEGSSMIEETMLRSVADTLGWDSDVFLRATESDVADTQYKASTQAAHARGVFGVPTVVIGGEMWWGNDRLDFVEEFLAKTAAV